MKTFFSWLGVTYYLSTEAINTMLAALSELCADGSSLVFDYPDENFFDASEKRVQNTIMMAKAGGCEFEDGVLNLKLQNSIVAEGKKDSIVNLLLEVFNNRFHVPLSVKVGYLPPKKKSALEFNDLLLQAEVDEIIERNEALRKEKQKKAGESENGGAQHFCRTDGDRNHCPVSGRSVHADHRHGIFPAGC